MRSLCDLSGGEDADVGLWSVSAVRLHVAEVSHDVHALADASEDRVLAVQVRRRSQRHEKLRAVRVGSCVRHRQDPGASVLELARDLVFEFAAKGRLAAATSPGRVATLDHKVPNDAVKLQAARKGTRSTTKEASENHGPMAKAPSSKSRSL